MARYERPGTKLRTLGLMTLRLVLFVTAVGWASRQFGPAAGIMILVSAIVTRGVFLRSRAGP